ncbi:hypothetical protein [Pseudomonas kilonensis]|uniref:hypothetical protein n=1 Tax=Pseudomonas kilonensis TaxID=132476 RepID=UPI0003FAFC79|nr:hypothetical protein [Pseudomonas kilonensis]
MSESADKSSSDNPRELLPPRIDELLDNIPGGEINLLPEAATHDDLKVWFVLWDNSDPTLGEESVELFLDGAPNWVDRRTWNAFIEPSDRYVTLPQRLLRGNDGLHRLHYRATAYNNESDDSAELEITLDTTPPVLAADSKLVFPPEVLPPNKLTARYLEQNNDEVKANLPGYTDPRPWDRITWYWGSTPGTLDKGGVIELDDQNFSDPVVVTISADLIQDRGDGSRYVWYEVQDRAGNVSPRSVAVVLDVDATPIPRTLPPAKVKEAPGGSSSGVLDPFNAVNGVTVIIPQEAVIYDGEGVFVQWAEPGTVGAYRTDTPNPAGSRDYKIPNDKIAQHLGKTISVRYEVFEPGVVEPHESNNYSLRVDELSGLPTIQCDKVSGGRLSLGSIADGGYASFTLERWTFMAVDQFLTVEVRGVDSGNQQVRVPVLTESPVPEVAQRISAGQISKTDLQRFKIGSPLEVRVSMSFDAKQTWKTFPRLTPTLVA